MNIKSRLKTSSVALLMVAVVSLLIIPLPTAILDFMFILNLTISLVILFITMYIKETLEFAIFPSLLLVTTVYRLSLNISSTRSILTNGGYAGEVVKTFGQFVIQGNIVVGLIIFLILVLVQFIVITKGAERVAEVSARFTLDALPGKQMAIDADLSSGLITEEQARERRSKIQREADFFGAMDGATKFVKGDAIISIIVTLINLIGGIVVGLINGEGDFMTIIQTYSISTVGDGLMSQIPSLLISMATGLVVTRSSSEADLNSDVIKQFSNQPFVLLIAGVVLPFLTLIGFPVPQTVVISIMLIALGVMLLKKTKPVGAEGGELGDLPTTQEVTSEVSYYKNLDNVYNLLNVDAICVEVGYSLLPIVDESSGGNFLDRVVMLRKHFADEMGMVIPAIRLKDSSQLNPNQYEIKLKGESVAVGEVLLDHYLGLVPAETPENDVDGIETVEPAFGMPAKWISDDKKIKAEIAGYTLIDPTSVMVTHLSEVIRRHASELLSRQEVKRMIENLKQSNESIVEDTVPAIVSLNELQRVLRNLLREGIPILDMETILETLADYAPNVKDHDMLTEYVRQALRRTITHKFSIAGQLKVVSLDSEIEDLIIKSIKKIEGGAYLALEPDIIQKIVTSTTEQINQMKKLVQEPIIITSPVVRIYFKKLLDQFYPDITVLSFNDIDTSVQIQSLGTITLMQVNV
ncbi:MAG: flagellar biosynthesis protein FlhA [Ruminococcaceae bacterium]|nr:flagellar biosynthesis protein FlhA [Oscillospiraceae bacterium]